VLSLPFLNLYPLLHSLRLLSLALLFLDNSLDVSPRITLGLSRRNMFDIPGKMIAALLGLPCMWTIFTKQYFNLFQSLTTGLQSRLAKVTLYLYDRLTSG